MRRRHGVDGGAAVNFRRRRDVGPKIRRRRGVGGQKNFVKDSRKKLVLSSKFSDDLFVIENCIKITTQQQWHRWRADKLSTAAARQSTKVGVGAHKLSAAAVQRGRRRALLMSKMMKSRW